VVLHSLGRRLPGRARPRQLDQRERAPLARAPGLDDRDRRAGSLQGRGELGIGFAQARRAAQ
jgi:hypothetical protein